MADFAIGAVDGSILTCAGTHQELLSAGDHLPAATSSGYPDTDDMLPFPAPPPAQLLNQQDITETDSDDEFPLPPPPDYEMTPLQAVRPVESANRFPGLMHSLSVRLAERSSVQMRAGPPVAAKQYRVTIAEQQQSASHATNLLSQIHRGVSLRRTISNDRSAPRISGKH